MKVRPLLVMRLECKVITIDQLLKEPLKVKEGIEFTGFYLKNNEQKQFICKYENIFYLINTNNINDLCDLFERLKIKLRLRDKSVLKLKNPVANKPHKQILHHASMSLKELMFLYKTYGNDLFLEDFFNANAGIGGNMHEFLTTIKEVIKLENEIKEKGITDPFEIMKFIYDKYKMECDYWNPLANYPEDGYGYFEPLEQDKNRVVKNPASYLGLICEKYATCAGMTDGLVQLFNYFGIDAEDIRDNKHAMVKVHIIDDNGQRKVSYIDLSREITPGSVEISPGWADTRYKYNNGHPIKRKFSISKARPDSYDFFMKAGINYVDDPDQPIAIDFEPQFRTPGTTINQQQQNNRIHLHSVKR